MGIHSGTELQLAYRKEPSMKRVALTLVALTLVLSAGVASAIVSAFDPASDYSTATWTNGSTGGYGFAPWTMTFGANAGSFIGTSVNNGGGGGAGIDTSGSSFGLWANNGSSADIWRKFTGGTLDNDYQIMLKWDSGYINGGGSSGWGLQNTVSNNLFEFYFAGGGSFYTIHDNAGYNNTTVGFTDAGLSFDFELIGPTNYVFHVINGVTTNTFTGSTISQADQGIIQAHMWNFNSGSTGAEDQFFNSLQVAPIPEPATLGLMALALAGMVVYRRRRG
jgi:hypothetical protein